MRLCSRTNPNRLSGAVRGRDHAHPARRGLHPEAPAFEVARHRPAARRRLPGLLLRVLPGLADRWLHLARPGRRERRDARAWARRGAIRARQRRDIGPRRYRDVRATRRGRILRALVRAAAAFAVASRALARLERAICWRCSWDSPPVPPTSDPPAGCRPGCPAAGSPAWCPGSGSAPAPGCRGPPRPADGSRRRMVRRNQGASRDRLRMTGCRPRGGPPALVPTEVDRAAPAVAPMRAAPTPRSPPEHCPSAGRRGRPPGRPRASHCSAQASLRDTP